MSGEAAIAVNTGRGGRDDPGAASPGRKMKFLCSYGGRILPRPIDGNLKYVGGETRVVAVPRDVTFPDLMRKLTEIFPGDVIFKFQILSQDLETLVSVRSDEDLKHMTDEYDRYKNEGTPKLRTFLFPAKPIVAETHLALTDGNALEQRYIDAINGIIRTTVRKRRPSTNANSVSSACPSPKSTSPDCHTVDSVAHDAMLSNAYQNNPAVPELKLPKRFVSPAVPDLALPKRFNMSRVHSSPSLYNLGNSPSPQSHSNNQFNSNNSNNSNSSQSPRFNGYSSNQINSNSNPHIYQQHSPQGYYQSQSQSQNQNHQQQYHHFQGYQSPSVRVTPEANKSGLPPWMVPSVGPMDRPDMSRFYVNQGPNYYYQQNVPQKWSAGGGGGNKYYDEASPFSKTPEVRSRAQSPRLEWSG